MSLRLNRLIILFAFSALIFFFLPSTFDCYPNLVQKATKAAWLWYRTLQFRICSICGTKDVLMDEWYMEYFSANSNEELKLASQKIAVYVLIYQIYWKIQENREELRNLDMHEISPVWITIDTNNYLISAYNLLMLDYNNLIVHALRSPDEQALCFLLNMKYQLDLCLSVPIGSFTGKVPICAKNNLKLCAETVREHVDQIEELILSDLIHFLPRCENTLKHLRDIGDRNDANEISQIRTKFVLLMGYSRMAMLCKMFYAYLSFLIPPLQSDEFYILAYRAYFQAHSIERKWRAKIVLEKFIYDGWVKQFFKFELLNLERERNEAENQNSATMLYALKLKKMFLGEVEEFWRMISETFWVDAKAVMAKLEETMKRKRGKVANLNFKGNEDKLLPKEMRFWWENGPEDTLMLRATAISVRDAIGEYNAKFQEEMKRSVIRMENLIGLENKAQTKMMNCVVKSNKKGRRMKDEVVAKIHLEKQTELVERGTIVEDIGEKSKIQFEKELREYKPLWKELLDHNGVKKLEALLTEHYFSSYENLDSSDSDENHFVDVEDEFEKEILSSPEKYIEEENEKINEKIMEYNEEPNQSKIVIKEKRKKNKIYTRKSLKKYEKNKLKKQENGERNEELLEEKREKKEKISEVEKAESSNNGKEEKPKIIKINETQQKKNKDNCHEIITKHLGIQKLADLLDDSYLAILYKEYLEEQKFEQKCPLGFLHISVLTRTIQAKLDTIEINKFNEQKNKIGIFEKKWNEFKGNEIIGEEDIEFMVDKLFFVQNLLECPTEIPDYKGKAIEILTAVKMKRIGKNIPETMEVPKQPKEMMRKLTQFGSFKIHNFESLLNQLHLHTISLLIAKNYEILNLKNKIDQNEHLKDLIGSVSSSEENDILDKYVNSLKWMIKQQKLGLPLNAESEQYNLIRTNIKLRNKDQDLSEEITNLISTHSTQPAKRADIQHFRERIESTLEDWMASLSIMDKKAMLLQNGSYMMGAELESSDLDLLCLVPDKLAFHNFYGDDNDSFHTFLKEKFSDESSKITRIVTSTRAPLIRIRSRDMEVELLFVPMPEKYLAEGANLESDDELIREMAYEPGIYAMAGYRAGMFQLSLVPDRDIFSFLLRALKVWAKNRQIYYGLFGYFNGASLSVMATKICTLYPFAPLSYLLRQFFSIFSKWDWLRVPLILNDLSSECLNRNVRDWPVSIGNGPMDTITPKFPEQNSTYNVNKFTFRTIIDELAYANDLLAENAKNWPKLFKEMDFSAKFKHFAVIICASEESSNCAYRKTKIRWDLLNWAQMDGKVEHYHVLPNFEKEEKCKIDAQKINCTLWLVGIILKNEFADEFTDLSPIYCDELNIQTNRIFLLSIFVKSIEEIDIQNAFKKHSIFIMKKKEDPFYAN